MGATSPARTNHRRAADLDLQPARLAGEHVGTEVQHDHEAPVGDRTTSRAIESHPALGEMTVMIPSKDGLKTDVTTSMKTTNRIDGWVVVEHPLTSRPLRRWPVPPRDNPRSTLVIMAGLVKHGSGNMTFLVACVRPVDEIRRAGEITGSCPLDTRTGNRILRPRLDGRRSRGSTAAVG